MTGPWFDLECLRVVHIASAQLFFQSDAVLDASVSRDYKRAGQLFGGTARNFSPGTVVSEVPPLTGLLDLEVYSSSIYTFLWSAAFTAKAVQGAGGWGLRPPTPKKATKTPLPKHLRSPHFCWRFQQRCTLGMDKTLGTKWVNDLYIL